jgi:hypothetical protein
VNELEAGLLRQIEEFSGKQLSNQLALKEVDAKILVEIVTNKMDPKYSKLISIYHALQSNPTQWLASSLKLLYSNKSK